jgi:hypothetical protein
LPAALIPRELRPSALPFSYYACYIFYLQERIFRILSYLLFFFFKLIYVFSYILISCFNYIWSSSALPSSEIAAISRTTYVRISLTFTHPARSTSASH